MGGINADEDDDDCINDGCCMEEACNRVLMTSKGLVIHAATVPAAPPEIRLCNTTEQNEKKSKKSNERKRERERKSENQREGEVVSKACRSQDQMRST